MNAYPRAVRHFGEVALQDRAPRTAGATSPRPRRVVVRLWLPTTALFCLLAPFALLIAPLGYLAPRRYRVSPFAAAFAIGRLLISLGGTVVHVDTPEALISLRLL